MTILKLTTENLNSLAKTKSENEILHGFYKGDLGFIVAAPDAGKGFLSLSLAYELATNAPLLGLSNSSKPIKVLYWPIEDGPEIVAQRIKQHFSLFANDVKAQIVENLSIWANDEAISCSSRLLNTPIKADADASLKKLCKVLESFDVLIIDTLREAVGTADEVEDDIIVKQTLKQIIKDTNTSVIAIHHLTKAAIRGNEKISSVSASGFSRTLANSRYQLLLENKVINNNKKLGTYLSHIKGNNVSQEFRFTNKRLTWTEGSLLLTHKDNFAYYATGVSIHEETLEKSLPQDIDLDDVLAKDRTFIELTEKQRQEDSFIDEDDMDAYKKWMSDNPDSEE